MISDPSMGMGQMPDAQGDMRRRALMQLLQGQTANMSPNNPAFRSPEGTMAVTGAQALGALGQNNQFMKWLSGQFDPAPKPGAVMPDALTGLLPGPR